MPIAIYKIFGELLDARSRQNIAGLRIEASYNLGNQVLLKQTAISGEDGQFTLDFTSDLFSNLSPNDSISVDFEVYQD